MPTVSSARDVRYCPTCGKKTEQEKYPVRSTPDGTVTKHNVRIECPEHGEITVRGF